MPKSELTIAFSLSQVSNGVNWVGLSAVTPLVFA
jgi:hypothetical protein